MLIWTKAIDNSGPYAIMPRSVSRRIEVRENYDSSTPPTADLRQYDAGDSTGARGCKVAKGTSAIFSSPVPFNPVDGVPAGYVNTASGSITVAIIEHENI
jgi:hypothetical protein